MDELQDLERRKESPQAAASIYWPALSFEQHIHSSNDLSRSGVTDFNSDTGKSGPTWTVRTDMQR